VLPRFDSDLSLTDFSFAGSQSLSANHNIMQIVDVCQEHEKQQKLHRLLEEIVSDDAKEKIIIFAETKRKVDDMTKIMRQYG
jgi:superfamily II DNA/RNA helicase